MISIIHSITQTMNRNEKSVLVAFDLNKAYDYIDDNILLTKLSVFCDSKTIEFFRSYLKKDAIL